MIPSINLDNQNVRDIFEAMLARMPQYYGEDMDISYQEPGVALLELFCLLKDMQQFYLNFVSDKHKMKYIKLMGGCRTETVPAETTLVFSGKGTLPGGFPAFAGDIRFETQEDICLSENQICAVACEQDRRVIGIPIWTRAFYPFGQDISRDASLYIGFKEDIHRYPVHSVFFELENPMPDLTVPLGEIQIRFFSSREKWEHIYFEDQTNCFSVSGKIHFRAPREMGLATINGLTLYWIRITLIKNDFELLPRLSGVYLNAVRAGQTRTMALSTEYTVLSDNMLRLKTFLEQNGKIELQKIGEGGFVRFDGYIRMSPEMIAFLEDCRGEKFLVLAWDKDCEMMPGGLNGTPNQRVAYHNAGGVQRLQIRQGLKPVWEIWDRCEDLAAADPLDSFFYVDDETVCFGNDENGAIPSGEAVRVIDCSLTEGIKGNVRQGVINRCAQEGIQVINVSPAAGGSDMPTVEEALEAARKSLDVPARAVTLEDYRQILLNMPRLAVEQVKALYDSGVIALYVKPKSRRSLPELNEAYKENIRAYIEPIRILTTQVDIRSPEYFGVVVYGDLVVEHSVYDVVKQVAEAVYTLLPREAGTFLESLSHGVLYGLIQSLPFVKQIRRLWFTCGGRTVKTGSYMVKQGGILYLENIKITLTAE